MEGSHETFFTGSVAAQNITNLGYRPKKKIQIEENFDTGDSMIIMPLLWHYYGCKPDQNCINLKEHWDLFILLAKDTVSFPTHITLKGPIFPISHFIPILRPLFLSQTSVKPRMINKTLRMSRKQYI